MIDQNDLNRLSPELQQRYRDYEELFATAGWGRLMEELKMHTGQLVSTALETIGDEKGLYFAKGQLRASLVVVNLEAGIEGEYQNRLQALDDDEEEAEASQGSNA